MSNLGNSHERTWRGAWRGATWIMNRATLQFSCKNWHFKSQGVSHGHSAPPSAPPWYRLVNVKLRYLNTVYFCLCHSSDLVIHFAISKMTRKNEYSECDTYQKCIFLLSQLTNPLEVKKCDMNLISKTLKRCYIFYMKNL